MHIDYARSIVSITNSVLKHYGVNPYHASLQELDKVFERAYKHVFYFVTDGLGQSMLKRHLESDAFLRRHQLTTVSSVFPPTTVAATTSILTGKTPYEHGHLGWFQYFQEADVYYTVFLKKDYYDFSKTLPKGFNPRFKVRPFTEIVKEKHAHLFTKIIYPKPIDPDGFVRFEEGLKQCLNIAKLDQKTLVYYYFTEPDLTAHYDGASGSQTKLKINALNAALERFYDDLPRDSLVILTADHGLIDVEPIAILDTPIMDTLRAKPSLEPRASVFHVKDKKTFEILFERAYSKYFTLYTTNAFLALNAFGSGERHPHIALNLGDYIAVAHGNKYFSLSEETVFKGHHAGSTDQELYVPLIVFKKE